MAFPQSITVGASWAGSSKSSTLTVIHDSTAPTVTITAPATPFAITEGQTFTLSASITDDVGVRQATAVLDGQSYPMAIDSTKPNIWNVTLTAPQVDGTADVPKQVNVTASDLEGNPSLVATFTFTVHPIIDALAPTLTWVCGGAPMYPSGTAATFSAKVTPATGDSINTVSITITGPSGPQTFPMSLVNGVYQATVTIPAAEDGTVFTTRVLANTFAGKSNGLPGTLTVLDDTLPTAFSFGNGGTINASDTKYEGATIIVKGGTLTISGQHTFGRLAVFNNANVVHVPTDATTINRLDIGATAVFIACGATIDVSGKGFNGDQAGFGRTWNNTFTGGSFNGAGGSHGGRGGMHDSNGDSGLTYGSFLDPNTPGGAGGLFSVGTCATCEAGGGIVRIRANAVSLDGKINANGVNDFGSGGGAGGSIRIDAATLSGGGEIHADGQANGHAAGGGGRVAVYYQALSLDRTKITADGGFNSSDDVRKGGSGTVYLRLVDASGAKVSDELIVDNNSVTATRGTTLPSLGAGTVTAVSGAVVTLSAPVPDWMTGSTIEFLTAGGVVQSSYPIAATTSTTVTLTLGTGESAPNVQVGMGYQGVWNIAAVTVQHNGMLDAPAVAATTLTPPPSGGLMRFTALRFVNGTIQSGRVEAGSVTAQNLTMSNGAVLAQIGTDATTIRSLQVNVTNALTVDATSSIDVSGEGFSGDQAGYGRTWNNTFTGGSFNGAGGSHGGRGGMHDSNGDSGAVYGSLFDPNTPGGAGGLYSVGTCASCNAGGGIARIRAGSLALDGKINANGVNDSGSGTGAGGSIRIDTGTLSGIGEIHADGQPNGHASGGGGRVAVYYQALTLDRTKITAAGGFNGTNDQRKGSPGTVYLRAAGQLYGDLVIANPSTTVSTQVTPILSIGSGSVTSLASSSGGAIDAFADTSAAFAAPGFLAGSRVYFNGDQSAFWSVTGNTPTMLTLDVTAQPLTAQSGQPYSGILRFDSITVANAKVATGDPIGSGTTVTGTIIVNSGRPVVTLGKISIMGGSGSDAISGSGGAILDADAPVTLLATNTRTGQTFAGTAAADGSFSLVVTGSAGDTFTLTATDSALYPLSTTVAVPGQYAFATGIPLSLQPPAIASSVDWRFDSARHITALVQFSGKQN